MRGSWWSPRWQTRSRVPSRFSLTAPHQGVSGLNAGWSLVDPAQDRLATSHVIPKGHPLIPPRDPEVGQRADVVTASSRASRARAADDDVERPARKPVLCPAAAQEPHEFLDLAEVRSASALPPGHDGDGPVPPRCPAHWRLVRPEPADPDRHPRTLHRDRQEDHVVDRDLVAPVSHRLTGPEQI